MTSIASSSYNIPAIRTLLAVALKDPDLAARFERDFQPGFGESSGDTLSQSIAHLVEDYARQELLLELLAWIRTHSSPDVFIEHVEGLVSEVSATGHTPLNVQLRRQIVKQYLVGQVRVTAELCQRYLWFVPDDKEVHEARCQCEKCLEKFRRAWDLQNDEKWDKARQLLQEILDDLPNYAEARRLNSALDGGRRLTSNGEEESMPASIEDRVVQANKIWRLLGTEELRTIEDNPGWDLLVKARRILRSEGHFSSVKTAKKCCQKSLELAESLGNPIGQGLAYMNKGTISLHQGEEHDAAIGFYEQSVKAFDNVGDTRLHGLALMCLGMSELNRCVELEEDDWGRIFSRFQKSETLLKQTGGQLLVEVQSELENARKRFDECLKKRKGDGRDGTTSGKGARPSKISLFPIVGTVAAGQPILARQNVVGYLDITDVEIDDQRYTIHSLESRVSIRLPLTATYFVLKVTGDSMVDIQILDGDYVLVRKQAQVEQGEIAVVQIEGKETEATLKRYYRERDHILLQPENSSKDPQNIPIEEADSVTVLGKALAVLKRA